MKRRHLRPVPTETLVDVPRFDPADRIAMWNNHIEAILKYIREFKEQHIQATPEHRLPCLECHRFDEVIDQIGGPIGSEE